MASHSSPVVELATGEPPAAKNLDCGIEPLEEEEDGGAPLVFTGIQCSS